MCSLLSNNHFCLEWIEHVDATGAVYYENAITHATQWEKPDSYQLITSKVDTEVYDNYPETVESGKSYPSIALCFLVWKLLTLLTM